MCVYVCASTLTTESFDILTWKSVLGYGIHSREVIHFGASIHLSFCVLQSNISLCLSAIGGSLWSTSCSRSPYLFHTSEYAKFAGLAGHVQQILKNVKQNQTPSPARVNQRQRKVWYSPSFHSEMSCKNSKCPAKDWRFAGQNVRQSWNEFRVLWYFMACKQLQTLWSYCRSTNVRVLLMFAFFTK